jgi:hypothetical protein
MTKIKALKLNCAVPDCTRTATTTAHISINNAPKKHLPVCHYHADAAKEDLPIGKPTFSVVITGTTAHEAVDDLKRLYGLPPFDGFNPCEGDNYYAKSLTEKYGMSIDKLIEAVDFKSLMVRWNRARAAFNAKTSKF